MPSIWLVLTGIVPEGRSLQRAVPSIGPASSEG